MATTVPNTFVNGTNADAAQVNANFTTVATAIDGVATEAGVVTPAVKMRGKSVIATQEARTNVAYGLLTTPDRVTGIVLPTDGLIAVVYQAMWFESVSGAAAAAIFVGANQLRIASVAGAPVVQQATIGGTVGTSTPLHSAGLGLISEVPGAAVTEVTTGQTAGASAGVTQNGICHIFAAAGTYDISVQFKASSGTVTALNRHLWVKAESYA